MRLLLLSWLFSLLFLFSAATKIDENESDLPVYLRGIGWRNVEDVLKKDLRLSSSVRPLHYDLLLNVTVGDGFDKKSTFEGTISIALIIEAPVNEIELHSLGLDILEAKLLVPRSNKQDFDILNNGQFSMREERETIVVPSIRLVRPGEEAILTIRYNGTARMNGGGFYESWNQRENSTGPPYISLQTHCEPTRARRWFPCFDEPDKKATFQLKVIHPKEATAYSNTHDFSSMEYEGKQLTMFEPTVPLSTYLVALAVTEQPVVELTVDGYEFRAIGFNREKAVRTAAEGLRVLLNHSIFHGVPFFPRKTDVLMVDDYSSGAMENPGLITYHHLASDRLPTHVHELAHMFFGNLVTFSSTADIWVNEGFARFFDQNMKPAKSLARRADMLLSLHDQPMHFERTFTSSIHLEKAFGAQVLVHYERAAQVIRMIRNFVGPAVFERAIKNYLLDNAYSNGDAPKVIKSLLDEYDGDRALLQKMLYEWIYQPGVAILAMGRDEEEVIIAQTRFHSSYFNEDLRDEHTRFTIPLFCEIDGVPQTIVYDSSDEYMLIPLPSNSSFSCEDDYGDLFGFWSILEEIPLDLQETYDWIRVGENLVRSGLIDEDDFIDAVSPFIGYSPIQKYFLSRVAPVLVEEKDVWSEFAAECGELRNVTNLEDLGKLQLEYLRDFNVSTLFCIEDFREREHMLWMLYFKIVEDRLKMKSVQLQEMIEIVERLHPGASMDFVFRILTQYPNNLHLRIKIREIIIHAYNNTKSDLEPLHELIRLHPTIAAENYDNIVQILEKRFVMEEFKRKDEILDKAILKMLNEEWFEPEGEKEDSDESTELRSDSIIKKISRKRRNRASVVATN